MSLFDAKNPMTFGFAMETMSPWPSCPRCKYLAGEFTAAGPPTRRNIKWREYVRRQTDLSPAPAVHSSRVRQGEAMSRAAHNCLDTEAQETGDNRWQAHAQIMLVRRVVVVVVGICEAKLPIVIVTES